MNKCETATVLAALRHWQNYIDAHAPGKDFNAGEFAGHFEDDKPLSITEINDLCEKINAPDLPFIVEISGGVAEVVQAPPDGRIIIWDWDNYKSSNPAGNYEPSDYTAGPLSNTDFSQREEMDALRIYLENNP